MNDDMKKLIEQYLEVMSLSHFVAFMKWQPDPKDIGPFAVSWFINEYFAHIRDRKLTIETTTVSAIKFRELLWFIYCEIITQPVGKKVLAKMFETGLFASQIILTDDLINSTNNDDIEKVVNEVIANNAANVAAYKDGKVKLFGSFVGQVMKSLQGKADPIAINKILKQKLDN